MIYNFEQFNENILTKTQDKILSWIDKLSSTDGRLLSADFYKEEVEKLENLGFIDDKNANHHKYEFNSESENINIIVKKYWDEEIPGYADSSFEMIVNGKKLKNFTNFNDLLNKIKEIIPEVEQNTSKYNL